MTDEVGSAIEDSTDVDSIKGIRVVTRDFQQCGILTTSVDLDEPVRPPFKLRSYK